jgi:hypothetical protein
MATSNTFRDDLRELIANYVQLHQLFGTGDATTAELIVMACIMSDEPLSLSEVSSWVRRHSTENHSDDLPTWLHDTRPDYMDFTVPICEPSEHGSQRWTSPIAAANVVLRRRLFPYAPRSPQAHFRIMDLPPEVRASVFEFALSLPQTGVWYDFQNRKISDTNPSQTIKVWTADRDLSSTMTRYLPSHWNTDKDHPWTDPKALFRVDLARHLTLFRVSQ